MAEVPLFEGACQEGMEPVPLNPMENNDWVFVHEIVEGLVFAVNEGIDTLLSEQTELLGIGFNTATGLTKAWTDRLAPEQLFAEGEMT